MLTLDLPSIVLPILIVKILRSNIIGEMKPDKTTTRKEMERIEEEIKTRKIYIYLYVTIAII